MQRADGANATVSVCHTRTRDLDAVTRQADIIIAAIGRARFLTVDMVKEGAVVIDVGINRVDAPERRRGYRLVGDVDYGPVSQKAGAITPVPGGVGPMTIAMLLTNALKAARLRIHPDLREDGAISLGSPMSAVRQQSPPRARPFVVRSMEERDLRQVSEVEKDAFPTQFPPTSFRRELGRRIARYLVVVRSDVHGRSIAGPATAAASRRANPRTAP